MVRLIYPCTYVINMHCLRNSLSAPSLFWVMTKACLISQDRVRSLWDLKNICLIMCLFSPPEFFKWFTDFQQPCCEDYYFRGCIKSVNYIFPTHINKNSGDTPVSEVKATINTFLRVRKSCMWLTFRKYTELKNGICASFEVRR